MATNEELLELYEMYSTMIKSGIPISHLPDDNTKEKKDYVNHVYGSQEPPIRFSDLKFFARNDLQHKKSFVNLSNPYGIQTRLFFDNGYGVSIVRFCSVTSGVTNCKSSCALGSHGHYNGLFELAVLTGNKDNWNLTYKTPVTNNVCGYCDEGEIEEIIGKVRRLSNYSG